jgi:hypothetical protein
MKKLFLVMVALCLMMNSALAVVSFQDDFNDLSQWNSIPSHCYAYDGTANVADGYYYSSLHYTSPSILTRSVDLDPNSDWKITIIGKVTGINYLTFFGTFIQEDCTPYTYTNNNYLYALAVESYYGNENVYVRMGGDGVNCIGNLPLTLIEGFTLNENHNFTQEKIGDLWSFYYDGTKIAETSLVCNSPELLTQFQLIARDDGFTRVDSIMFEQFPPDGNVSENCTPLWIPSDWTNCEFNGSVFMQSRSFTDLYSCGEPAPADEYRACGKAINTYGRTTDFDQVADPTNVKEAIYETPSGYIMWNHSIDITNVDLDEAIIITNDLLFVNKSLITDSMDAQALVSFQMDRTYDWCDKGFQLYYAEEAYSDIKQLAQAYSDGKALKMADKTRIGLDCYDPSVCQDVTCSNSKVGFQSEHFSGFGILANETYVTSDLPLIVQDGLGTAGATFVLFLPIIIIGGILIWGYTNLKKVKK